MAERQREQVRSDYNSTNRYSAAHPDALANGDRQGKGTGHGGHSHWLPNCNGQLGLFNYSNFDTDISSGAGNDTDNAARQQSIVRSMYGFTNAYGEQLIDRSFDLEYQATIASGIRGARTVGG